MRWPWLVIALAACQDFRLDPIDDPGPPARVVVEDEFVQGPLPAVDVLFVIDDTGSMAQEQNALAEEFSHLAAALTGAGVSWQVGVVTTDVTRSDAGYLLGHPWVLTPDVPDVDAAFAANARVGTSGQGPEAGLASAVWTLDAAGPDGVNAGFRREGAGLHVIFLSDADDQSDAVLGNEVVDAFAARLAAEATPDAPARASAIVGDVPDGCVSGAGTAQPGTRYTEVALGSGGTVGSICAADFSAILDDLGQASIAFATEFVLRATPEEGSIRVSVDGMRVLEGWTLELGPARVVFEEPPPADARIVVSYAIRTGTEP